MLNIVFVFGYLFTTNEKYQHKSFYYGSIKIDLSYYLINVKTSPFKL